MMKKRIGIGFIGIVLVLMFTAPSFAQVIKLRLADQNPPQGWGPVNALQPWIKKVEAATKNRVKIEVYPSQTLCKGPDTWNSVKSGVADIGWCNHGYWPEMTPLFEAITLPALPCRSSEHGSGVLWQLYEKFPSIQKEFKDVHPILIWTSPPRFPYHDQKTCKDHGRHERPEIEDFWRTSIRTAEGAWSHSHTNGHVRYL